MQLPPLIKGRLVRRYQRFLADIVLESGEQVVAHCPNTGRMQGCNTPNAQVWVSDSQNPKRRCRYTWELIATPESLVGIHTGRANDLVAEALQHQRLPLDTANLHIKREVKLGDSRLDMVLYDEHQQLRWVIEVKNVTLRENQAALFPDAPSVRGRKHIQCLMELTQQGIQSALVFCVQRGDVCYFNGAYAIDPLYHQMLHQAQAAGVHLWAIAADPTPEQITLQRLLPIQLSP